MSGARFRRPLSGRRLRLAVMFPRTTALLADVRGVAAVEVTILLSTLGIGLAAMGYSAGPAIKAYADRLSAVVAEARCLAAVPPGDPLPACPPAAP